MVQGVRYGKARLPSGHSVKVVRTTFLSAPERWVVLRTRRQVSDCLWYIFYELELSDRRLSPCSMMKTLTSISSRGLHARLHRELELLKEMWPVHYAFDIELLCKNFIQTWSSTHLVFLLYLGGHCPRYSGRAQLTTHHTALECAARLAWELSCS